MPTFRTIVASAIEKAKGETDQIECPNCGNTVRGKEDSSYKNDNSIRKVVTRYSCPGCNYKVTITEEFPVIHRAAN